MTAKRLVKFITLLIWLLFTTTPANAQSNNLEQNKAVVRRWIEEGFNKKSLKVVDEIFAQNFVVNGFVLGRENLKQNMTRRFAAFPDLSVTIDKIIGEGNMVGIWYTARGTHKGEFERISATGRAVSWFGFDLLEFEDGKVAQARFVDDTLGLMRQIGVTLLPPLSQK